MSPPANKFGDATGHRLLSWLIPTAPEYEAHAARRAWLVTVYTARRWLLVDRAPLLASSLTLETLLAIVPTAGVLLFFVRFLDPDFGRQFLARLASGLIPEASRAEEFTRRVVELGANVNVERLGLWGFLVVTLLAFWLFVTLERTFNQIWRVARTRSVFAKFAMFYTLATLAPVVAFYSLAQPVLAQVTESFLVTPWFTSALGLTLINRWVPNTRVHWSAALAGGCMSAILFEMSKLAFGAYVTHVSLSTYEGVYGSAAIVPVFLVWSYLVWLIVLLGAELSFVLQHIASVARQGYVDPFYRHPQRLRHAPGRAATRLLLAICDNYTRRELGSTADGLDSRFQLGLVHTLALLEGLEAAGFIVPLQDEQGYVPARPLDEITVLDALRLFDEVEVKSARRSARGDVLGELYTQLDTIERTTVGNLDFSTLVAGSSVPATPLPMPTAGSDTPSPPIDQHGDRSRY